MTLGTLIWRSLRFHARAHFGVVLGAAIGSAALIGALVVGDSVRGTLREQALQRLGKTEYVLNANDRLFGAGLAGRLRQRLSTTNSTSAGKRLEMDGIAPLLMMPASAVRQDGQARANQVRMYGVDPQFAEFAGAPSLYSNTPPEGVLVNERLAVQLRLREGDTVIFRVAKSSALSREAVISPKSDQAAALRLTVSGIAPAAALANFELTPNQVAPLNAFIRLDTLEQAVGATNQANLLLIGPEIWQGGRPLLDSRKNSSTETRNALNEIFQDSMQLRDFQLRVLAVPQARELEIRSPRIFLGDQLQQAMLQAKATVQPGDFLRLGMPPPEVEPLVTQANELTNSLPLLTYLANQLIVGTNLTPYSMVTAAGPPYTPPDLHDDEIVLNQWLAEDLGAKAGDQLALAYFDPEASAHLQERTNVFVVRNVVPMQLPWTDRTLMPDFPGLEHAESTHDWDAGFPLVYKIRTKDEDYWKKFRGTPKAFVTLAAGQRMWANRFGSLTAIRFPAPASATTDQALAAYRAALEAKVLSRLKPDDVGFHFEPVREQALNAAAQGQDFGQLFLGFSIFLVVAALLLMALLFQFGLEQRATEVGTFLALGFTPRRVRRLLLSEALVLALIGGLIGAAGGLAYARAMLWGLTTIWRRAVAESSLQYHITPTTLVIGLLASTIVAGITIWFTLRKQAKQPASVLLAEGGQQEDRDLSAKGGDATSRKPKRGLWLAWTAGLAAIAVAGWGAFSNESDNAGAFFGAGALLLLAGLGWMAAWLRALARKQQPLRLTVGSLGVRTCARRRKRSLATIALLACGCFVIVAIGVFRLDANRDAFQRSSGTGGFSLIGNSTLPVVQDLNTKAGREFFGLSEAELSGVNVVALRVHDGDEASCLNLNRSRQPRVLGVRPELLAGRFTFAAVAKGLDPRQDWGLLGGAAKDKTAGSSGGTQNPAASTNIEEIPAIGDANSIEWALGKKLGDTIDYVDEHGRPFKLRLVGAVANSILQGSLIIDEAEFTRRFPGESGYRLFLLDTPTNSVAKVSATLSRALQDVGFELTPAVQRLNEFNAVQNTYLGTFQILGGLGLLLGSAGLGVVVLRNVLERRGELGLLVAVGFRKEALHRMILIEHGALLGLGLGIGILAAVVAVLPSLIAHGRQVPYGSLVLTLIAVLLNGVIWTWLATRFALRGNLLAALRNE